MILTYAGKRGDEVHYVMPGWPQVWAQKQGLVLTGGTYKVPSDDVLVESKLRVDLAVVELDAMDNLFFFSGNICLMRGVSRCTAD